MSLFRLRARSLIAAWTISTLVTLVGALSALAGNPPVPWPK